LRKILIIRTDRLGDVILTTPVACALKKKYPDSAIVFWGSDYTKEVLKQCTCVDSVITFPENISAAAAARELKKESFDVSILVHSTFKLAYTLFLARIPVRIGTGYRFYSFLLNKRWYEHRKYSTQHEVDYNLNLLKTLGIEEKDPHFSFTVPKEAENSVSDLMKELELQNKENIIVLHPGSGGSAPGWSAHNFSRLSDQLTNEGFTVLITGGKEDTAVVDEVVSGCEIRPLTLPRLLTLKELMAFLKNISLFVSNSTGPLHLARALGTGVLGLYPPLVTASATRWGPYNGDDMILSPDVPPCKKCSKEQCARFDCMNLITVEIVYNKITALMTNKSADM